MKTKSAKGNQVKPAPVQCCKRDHNHDGNCNIHPAPKDVKPMTPQQADVARYEARKAREQGKVQVDEPIRIQVDHKYTYLCNDKSVKVGDRVELPSTRNKHLSVDPGVWEGEVTALSSEYSGPCKSILRILR